MLTGSRESSYTLEQSLSPDDQAMFALFLQYPEIDFADYDANSDEVDGPGPAENNHDVAISADEDSTLIADHESMSTNPNLASISAAHSGVQQYSTGDTWSSLQKHLEVSNLPANTIVYFRALATTLQNLGSEMTATVRPGKASGIAHLGQWLINSVTYSASQAELQAMKATSLSTLVAFNTQPTTSYVHSTLQQRARLITT